MEYTNIKDTMDNIKSDDELEYPLMLKCNGKIKQVLGPITSEMEPFRDGKGYVDNGQVWIFSKCKPNNSEYPYFWYEHGKICFGKVRDSIKNDYMTDKLVSLALTETVYKMDPDVPLYDEEALRDMNAATSVFTPEIDKDDDCLKVLIKKTIINKKINIHSLKSKMGKSYALSNLKTALMNKTKMSIPNFILWCDLLNVTFDISINDNGLDNVYPLKHSIHYDSATDVYTEE